MSTTTDGFPFPPASDALGNGAQWMQDMAEFLDGKWTPWTAYTPVIDGLTLGNGSIAGAYRRLFDTVEFRISVVIGSTSVVGGFEVEYAPAGLPSDEPAFSPIGFIIAHDSSAPLFRTGVLVADGALQHGSTYFDSAAGIASSTTPFTWASGDSIRFRGSYRTSA